MPFVYRLQKILDFRVRKKEEQLIVVQKAQQAVFEAEQNIRKNNEEIASVKFNQRSADPRMMDYYDNYLHHLWDKAEQLEIVKAEKEAILKQEVQILVELEMAVKVLEKHKEKNYEAYLEEEKAIEIKKYSELGVVRYFAQTQEAISEEEQELLRQLQLEEEMQ